MFSLSACGQEIPNSFHTGISNTSFQTYQLLTRDSASSFAQSLCVGESNVPSADYAVEKATAAALFDLDHGETLYASNMHDKKFPASLTKVLTALVAIKHGELDQVLTATSVVNITESGAQLIGLKVGDTLTLEQALNILLIYSANDVANLIAENIAGSVDEFMVLMNEEAHRLGATNTNFVNPHGLHDDEHYTTAYDLYLIFQEALKYDEFTQIIGQVSYSTTYIGSDGKTNNVNVNNTNGYFRETYSAPSNVTILGGKTGTTNSAAQCLILSLKDNSGNDYIAVILGGATRDDLYSQMSQMFTSLIP